MPLTTTTIGAYPKPKSTPIRDFFLADRSTEERKASPGLLANWRPGAYEAGLAAAGANAEKLFLEATREAIKDQVVAGVDIPTDGEIRRENYIFYQCRNFEGISFEALTRKSVRGTHEAELPTVIGPINFKAPRLDKEWIAAQQFTEKPVKITLPGPLTIADSVANSHYSDQRKLGEDLADALNKEILALSKAGCRFIQVDEPLFARKPKDACDFGVEHLDRTFANVPPDVVRIVHICCGYPNALDSTSYRKADLDAYFKIADALEQSSIDQVSIEDAHRNNDLKLLERFENTAIIFGAVNVAKSRVETVDEVRDRLLAALEHIDSHRLVAAPDCGLGLLTREMAMAKLRVLSKAAKSI